jgi:hypothetical protein
MAAAESTPVAPKPEKPKKSPAERYEGRKALLQLLLIALVAVAIVYLGLNVGFAVIGFVLWIIARITGVS